MPIAEIHGEALQRDRRIMEQVFDGGDRDASVENARRPRSPRAKAAVQLPAATGNTPQGGSAPVAPAPKPVPPPEIIDRVHKESSNLYGGYIILGPDHDASESDQMPPSNPGWRTPSVAASSLNDAYNKAVIMKAVAQKVDARIEIIILGGVWVESLHVNVAGIDIRGVGRTRIVGDITVGPFADMRLREFESVGTITYLPCPDMDPRAGLGSLYDVRMYCDTTCFHAQRRLYLERCEFWQTSRIDVVLEVAACKIEYLPLEAGWTVFKNCRFYAWYDNADMTTYGTRPYGFAIHARALSTGNFVVDTNAHLIPNSGVVLDQCEVFGSLLIEQWTVEHKGGHQHGGIPIPTRSGDMYLRMRGMPLFDPSNGYVGSQLAYATFDNTAIHSEVIGQFVPWAGAIPLGLKLSDYPGVAYVAVRHSAHLYRYDGAAAQVFINMGAIAHADLVNASTGASTWLCTDVGITTYGACPTSVLGNREFYQI